MGRVQFTFRRWLLLLQVVCRCTGSAVQSVPNRRKAGGYYYTLTERKPQTKEVNFNEKDSVRGITIPSSKIAAPHKIISLAGPTLPLFALKKKRKKLSKGRYCKRQLHNSAILQGIVNKQLPTRPCITVEKLPHLCLLDHLLHIFRIIL